MAGRELLTIDKIPVRLSLSRLSSDACLTYSGRHYFSALEKHPLRHPLIHQIDSNPDCQALAITADNIPMAHCFFHYRVNTEEKKYVVLHNFMVAPCMRRRGLGSLLALYFLKALLTPKLQHLVVEVEFPRPEGEPNFASSILGELIAAKTFAVGGMEIPALLRRVAEEEKSLSRRILTNLITKPEFRARLAQQGCYIGAASDNNVFFDGISNLAWPPYAVVQSIHTDFHTEIETKVNHFDFLVLDARVLKNHPQLLDKLSREKTELPLVIVGGEAPPENRSVLLTTELPELMTALDPYLAPYDPALSQTGISAVEKDLLHLPERGSLASHKNRHRNRRIFIVASGPSLAEVDPEPFRNELTITINDALTKFPRTRYAAIMDSRKLHELHAELLNVEAVFTLKGNSYGIEIDLLGTEGFSTDLEAGIYSGYTTAYFTLQLALYMGSREIYYLGLDLGNTAQRSHFFGSRSLQDRDRPEVYAKMRQSFERIAETAGKMGAHIYNCSPVSELKCFPYRSVEEALSEPQGRSRVSGGPIQR